MLFAESPKDSKKVLLLLLVFEEEKENGMQVKWKQFPEESYEIGFGGIWFNHTDWLAQCLMCFPV